MTPRRSYLTLDEAERKAFLARQIKRRGRIRTVRTNPYSAPHDKRVWPFWRHRTQAEIGR